MKSKTILNELKKQANSAEVAGLQRFFKTAPGEYGEGDVFLGIRVPEVRKLVREFRGTELTEVLKLLQSRYHEARVLALLMMVDAFERADEKGKQVVYKAYLANTEYINNWDLVDLSAYKIAGPWLFERSHAPLIKLAKSKDLWEKRVSVISTFYFIKREEFETTFKIAEILLDDPHDLIHKAVGWMLREVGNIDREAEKSFLAPRYKQMPRTMLRYAIEKFEESLRQDYLKGRIL